jgi:hypothetical protein
VLDRAGRLQIPRDFIDTLGMRDRVLLALEPDHLGVWPDTASPPARPSAPHTAHGQGGEGGHTRGRHRVQGSEGDQP